MLRKAKNAVVTVAAIAAAVAYGNTGTVTASLDGGTFNVAFANHAHETNSLWVVYDGFDYGPGTNGWGHVERLGTVHPGTDAWAYAAPAGWGETVKAVRFILSEVPYDYDYSLDFLRSGRAGEFTGGNRICLSDFTMKGSYRVCLKMREFRHNGGNNLALFSTRAGVGDVNPKYTLFWIGGTKWRWDYGSSAGDAVSGATTNVFYEIGVSGKYGVVDLTSGSVIASKKSTSALTGEELRGKLEFFCANNAAGTMSNSHGQMELYWAQVYGSPEANATLLVNLVPMVKGGRGGMYDTVNDKFYYSDTGMEFDLANGPSRVESANPFFADTLCKAAVTGSEVFTPASAVTVSQSITNAYGGILDGTATLTLTGENDWGGAFTVSNGTLVATFGQGLAATDCLRLLGEDKALGGAGAVGSFACGASLEGALHVDLDATTGTADKIVADGTLDISSIDLVLPEALPEGATKLQVVAGATTGAFRSVENLPRGWAILPKATGLWAQKVVGTTIIFR